MSILDGYKSYIGGALMIIMGIGSLVGVVDLNAIHVGMSPGELIAGGWALISVKSAIVKS